MSALKVRAEYDEKVMIEHWDRLKQYSSQDFISLKKQYHSECCKEITNKTKIQRAKERFDTKRNNENDVCEDINLSTENIQVETSAKARRKTMLFNKNLCVICQKESERGIKLHSVEFNQTGERMLEVAKQLTDQSMFVRLNSVPNAADAVANDV